MNLLFKNVLVKVRKSFGRFASLFIIIAVGVGFFAGIRASSPDVVASVDAYYDENNFMDFKIVSSMGLTDDDVNAIKVQDSAGTVIPSYSLDVLCDGKAVRIHAIEDTVNRVTLTEGRMPQSTRECIADSRHYKIGDTVHITDDIAGKLKYSEYTVAGTVKSVLYLFGDYGISNIGDGKLSSFIFVGKENFLSEYYTEIYVTAKRTKNVQLYSGEYESCAALLQNQLLQVKPERETARYEFILNTAAAEIDKAETKLKNEKSKGEKELADAKALLDGNSVKLRDAKSELSSREQSLHAVLTSGREQLAAEEQKLTAGYDEYYANLKKFKAETADAEAKIAAEKEKLSDIAKPEWYIFDRTDAVGYTALKEDTDKVTLIAGIFPLFFILIVALMSFNTMTRMIEEERGELGILASLGFSDAGILSAYLLYVLTASISGIVCGFFAGSGLIPKIIYSCYDANYILPPLLIKYDMAVFTLIVTVSVALMVSLTVIVCLKELKQKPATLLRPAPPKKGQTVFLEKIGSLWNRLTFTWKVTMRNMFRYKKRVLMTILGIAGCTALLLTGYGIRDSIDGIAQKQYGNIFKYDDLIVLKDETQAIDENLQKLLETEKILNPVLIRQTSFICETGSRKSDVNLVVPENENSFYKYFILNSKLSGNHAVLSADGVVITQKLADLTGAGAGDTLTIKNTDNVIYTVKVSDIAENYTMHFIYMSKELYSKVFGENVSYNMIVSGHRPADESALAGHLMDSGRISNVSFTTDSKNTFSRLVASLNNIILLIIAASSLLALIVLYNLTSINISERKREIATLKVLGFYDNEVNQYIYRETLILTLFSIGIGLILGILLHRPVIRIIEVDSSVFIKTINTGSYIWSFLIMAVFSVTVQIITYFKLKSINMIESLKTVE